MASNIIEEGFEILINNGLIEFLVFALIFAVTFGVLQNVKLFSNLDEKELRKYNAIISLALGALSLVPHYISRYSKYDIVAIVEQAVPQTMLFLIVILGALILLGMFGWNSGSFSNGWVKVVIGFGLLGVVGWIFLGATDLLYRLPNWLSHDLIAIIVAIAVFGGVVSWIMGSDDEDEKTSDKKKEGT